MKIKLAASAVALLISTAASATAINFTNGSGSYSASGITATVTAGGGSISYNSSEPNGGAIGVIGIFNPIDGAMGPNESLTVTFNQAVKLNSLSFSSWNNGFDSVTFNYAGGSQTFGTGGSATPTFSTGGVTLSSFTISTSILTPLSSVYLHSLDATAAVPLPGAALFMSSGLLGMAGLARRKRISK